MFSQARQCPKDYCEYKYILEHLAYLVPQYSRIVESAALKAVNKG